ncbi:hypothetical protein AB4Z29_17210 [Paenibacillus sp. 2TAB23]|uniref:hypothetical protein n=1 Tax=Paenibacillus sp. 2TAB23 TaxID=3233004 RepID=UPI003F9EA69C
MFCPVCNGIQSLHERCSSCDSAIVDCGRSSDLTGPYAPYGQIDVDPLRNEAAEQAARACMHMLYCPTCSQATEVSVIEW